MSRRFTPAHSITCSKGVLVKTAMRDVSQKKISVKASSSSITQNIEVTELNDFKYEVAIPKIAINIDDNSTRSLEIKEKGETSEIDPNDKTIRENTTAKPAGSGEALEIPVLKKAPTSTTESMPAVHSSFDDQPGYMLPAGYPEFSMEIDEVSSFWADNCRLSSCLHECTTDSNCKPVPFSARVSTSRNITSECVFVKSVSGVSA